MVEDTLKKVLDEYKEESQIDYDNMYESIKDMDIYQRHNLTNKLLEDLESYENYFELERLGQEIDRYLNGDIAYSSLQINIPKTKKLNFPEPNIEEKKEHFDKKLYNFVLHEIVLGERNVLEDKNIKDNFVPILNDRIERLKESVYLPKEIVNKINEIDRKTNNHGNRYYRYLNPELLKLLYLFENEYKMTNSFERKAYLEIEEKNLISNLEVNETAIKELKKKKHKFFAIMGAIYLAISLFMSSFFVTMIHKLTSNDEDKTMANVGYGIMGVMSIYLLFMIISIQSNDWHDKPEYRELIEKKKLVKEDIPKLEKIVQELKEIQEREIMAKEVEEMKTNMVVDKELEESKPTGLRI